MVWLLAAEHGVNPPRATDDMDIAVDIQSDKTNLRRICEWLEAHDLSLEGISTDGIGHRYTSRSNVEVGQVSFDVLAPDHIGLRADLVTTPPARTLQAPGARLALKSAESIPIQVEHQTGYVLRPTLIAAIMIKAAATTISGRPNPGRDWSDVAFLLTLINEPLSLARSLSSNDRRRLRRVEALLDPSHSAWQMLGQESAKRGSTALEFLIG